MTAKHATAGYRRNAGIIRDRVRAIWRDDEAARCWRGGGPIPPGTPFDVGHIDRHAPATLENLAPEHRSAYLGCCTGNRADGGTYGAAATNARHASSRPASEVTTWAV